MMPVPTICSISGACIGAGWFLALAHDNRFMARTDDTFVQTPEINLGVPIPYATMELLKSKVDVTTLTEFIYGEKISAMDCYEKRLAETVDRGLLEEISEIKAKHYVERNINRDILTKIKHITFKDVHDECAKLIYGEESVIPSIPPKELLYAKL